MSGQHTGFFTTFYTDSQSEESSSQNQTRTNSSSQDKGRTSAVNWDQEVESVLMDEIQKFSKQFLNLISDSEATIDIRSL